MSIERKKLVKFLNKKLDIYSFKDYGPNGLQIEGNEVVNRVAFALSASRESIEQAVKSGADTLIVHHGLFWNFHGVRTLTGPFYQRVAPLVQNNLNLLAYHLPLDGNLEFGNAKQIANFLKLEKIESFGDYKGSSTGVKGHLKKATTVEKLETMLTKYFAKDILISANNKTDKIKSIGIITGGANGDWLDAYKNGLDAYITGEMSEHDWNESKEYGVSTFACGHYATEKPGILALMKLMQEQFKVDTLFIDSENPA